MVTKVFTSLKEAQKVPQEVREFSLDCYREKNIRVLPEFPNLEALTVIYYDTKQIDQILPKLKGLKRLTLSWGEKYFPESIFSLKELEHLEVSHSPLKITPPQINSLQSLKYLNLSYLQLKKLPIQLFDLTQLNHLILENNKLESIPDAIANLKKLKFISLYNNLLKELPTEFALLPLEGISLGFNPVIDLSGLTDKNLKELFKQFIKREIPLQRRALYFQLLLRNFKKAEKVAGNASILTGLNGFIPEIRLNAAKYFYESFENPFEKSAEELQQFAFCIVGQVRNYHQAEIQEVLKKRGITLHTDIRKSTTHIILGELPRKKLYKALKSGKKLVASGHLTDFIHRLKGYYLMKEDPETELIAGKVLRLLESKEEANQKLALELALGGGLHPTFMYEIILLYIWNKNSEIKKIAEQILEKHLPADTFLEIKTHQKIFDVYPNEETLAEYLNNICGKKLDPNELGIRMYRKNQRGRLFCLRYPKSFVEVCKDEIQHNVLSINDLNLKKIHNSIAELSQLKFLYANHNYLSELPPSLNKLNSLYYLYLHNNAFREFPQVLLSMKNLKKLSLNSNRIEKIPKAIDQMLNLEQLHLKSNKITTIPSRITNLKKLKVLTLSKNPIAQDITMIEELRHALPNCHIRV